MIWRILCPLLLCPLLLCPPQLPESNPCLQGEKLASKRPGYGTVLISNTSTSTHINVHDYFQLIDNNISGIINSPLCRILSFSKGQELASLVITGPQGPPTATLGPIGREQFDGVERTV
jgi:hypothetical protein